MSGHTYRYMAHEGQVVVTVVPDSIPHVTFVDSEWRSAVFSGATAEMFPRLGHALASKNELLKGRYVHRAIRIGTGPPGTFRVDAGSDRSPVVVVLSNVDTFCRFVDEVNRAVESVGGSWHPR